MSPMYYLDKDDLVEWIFSYVEERYGRIEEVPDYINDPGGMPQLLGVLERVQMDTYYPSVLDKANYLLIGINKGHFFGNGNKRLALVVTTAFLVLNERSFRNESKDFYLKLLSGLFPEQTAWIDFPEFSPTDYATYNLSIVIADSGALEISHEVLKKRTLRFFEASTVGIDTVAIIQSLQKGE